MLYHGQLYRSGHLTPLALAVSDKQATDPPLAVDICISLQLASAARGGRPNMGPYGARRTAKMRIEVVFKGIVPL